MLDGSWPQRAGAARGDAAWRGFTFAELCEQPLGAADYLQIAHEFHTLVIDRIPVMDFDRRNAAKRFIILIDTLYDLAVKLVASAEAEPDASIGRPTASRRRNSSAPLHG